jgi:hypothetical protein
VCVGRPRSATRSRWTGSSWWSRSHSWTRSPTYANTTSVYTVTNVALEQYIYIYIYIDSCDLAKNNCHKGAGRFQKLLPTDNAIPLKGLSHEIFGPVYWPVWIHKGLNKSHFWFLNFKEAPSIWGSHFKFLCVSVKPSRRFLESRRRIGNWDCGSPILVDFWLAILREMLLRV